MRIYMVWGRGIMKLYYYEEKKKIRLEMQSIAIDIDGVVD